MILEVPTRPRAKGHDISYDWPELDQFIRENYKVMETQEHHVVYLKNGL